MIASLPMYDWDEVRAPTDRLWGLVRDNLRASGVAAPDALQRGGDMWGDWLHPDLILSQTCGFPYRGTAYSVAFQSQAPATPARWPGFEGPHPG